MSLVTGLSFLVLLLNQRWSPPLRLQVSHCSTFRSMFVVPNIIIIIIIIMVLTPNDFFDTSAVSSITPGVWLLIWKVEKRFKSHRWPWLILRIASNLLYIITISHVYVCIYIYIHIHNIRFSIITSSMWNSCRFSGKKINWT